MEVARLAVILAMTSGCGRIAFDSLGRGSPTDAIPTDATPADACAFGPFGNLRRLAEVAMPTQEWGPWLSPDGLELWFTSDRSGVFAIYRAVRGSRSAMFGSPLLYDLGISPSGDPFESEDGLTLWFDDSTELWVATRGDRSSAFGVATHLVELSSAANENNPSVTSDELTIAFSSSRSGSTQIYLATRARISDPFGAPSPVAELDTASIDASPHLARDGSSMIFWSDLDSPGVSRIYTSARVGGVFQTPVLLDPGLAGADGQETDVTITPDGTLLVFASNRSGGAGGYDLYIAERSCQ